MIVDRLSKLLDCCVSTYLGQVRKDSQFSDAWISAQMSKEYVPMSLWPLPAMSTYLPRVVVSVKGSRGKEKVEILREGADLRLHLTSIPQCRTCTCMSMTCIYIV